MWNNPRLPGTSVAPSVMAAAKLTLSLDVVRMAILIWTFVVRVSRNVAMISLVIRNGTVQEWPHKKTHNSGCECALPLFSLPAFSAGALHWATQRWTNGCSGNQGHSRADRHQSAISMLDGRSRRQQSKPGALEEPQHPLAKSTARSPRRPVAFQAPASRPRDRRPFPPPGAVPASFSRNGYPWLLRVDLKRSKRRGLAEPGATAASADPQWVIE